MKDYILILLGKEINQPGEIDQSIYNNCNGIFKSECYYDWIQLKTLATPTIQEDCNVESLLIESYKDEIKSRQKMINKGLHIQQGITALPVDDKLDEENHKNFLEEIKKTGIIFLSFINVPALAQEEKRKIIEQYKFDKSEKSVNEIIMSKIISEIDLTSMRLFCTFDHNDFVIICNGDKTDLQDYIKILEKIRVLTLTDEYNAVHDITSIYGYKSIWL